MEENTGEAPVCGNNDPTSTTAGIDPSLQNNATQAELPKEIKQEPDLCANSVENSCINLFSELEYICDGFVDNQLYFNFPEEVSTDTATLEWCPIPSASNTVAPSCYESSSNIEKSNLDSNYHVTISDPSCSNTQENKCINNETKDRIIKKKARCKKKGSGVEHAGDGSTGPPGHINHFYKNDLNQEERNIISNFRKFLKQFDDRKINNILLCLPRFRKACSLVMSLKAELEATKSKLEEEWKDRRSKIENEHLKQLNDLQELVKKLKTEKANLESDIVSHEFEIKQFKGLRANAHKHELEMKALTMKNKKLTNKVDELTTRNEFLMSITNVPAVSFDNDKPTKNNLETENMDNGSASSDLCNELIEDEIREIDDGVDKNTEVETDSEECDILELGAELQKNIARSLQDKQQNKKEIQEVTQKMKPPEIPYSLRSRKTTGTPEISKSQIVLRSKSLSNNKPHLKENLPEQKEQMVEDIQVLSLPSIDTDPEVTDNPLKLNYSRKTSVKDIKTPNVCPDKKRRKLDELNQISNQVNDESSKHTSDSSKSFSCDDMHHEVSSDLPDNLVNTLSTNPSTNAFFTMPVLDTDDLTVSCESPDVVKSVPVLVEKYAVSSTESAIATVKQMSGDNTMMSSVASEIQTCTSSDVSEVVRPKLEHMVKSKIIKSPISVIPEVVRPAAEPVTRNMSILLSEVIPEVVGPSAEPVIKNIPVPVSAVIPDVVRPAAEPVAKNSPLPLSKIIPDRPAAESVTKNKPVSVSEVIPEVVRPTAEPVRKNMPILLSEVIPEVVRPTAEPVTKNMPVPLSEVIPEVVRPKLEHVVKSKIIKSPISVIPEVVRPTAEPVTKNMPVPLSEVIPEVVRPTAEPVTKNKPVPVSEVIPEVVRPAKELAIKNKCVLASVIVPEIVRPTSKQVAKDEFISSSPKSEVSKVITVPFVSPSTKLDTAALQPSEQVAQRQSVYPATTVTGGSLTNSVLHNVVHKKATIEKPLVDTSGIKVPTDNKQTNQIKPSQSNGIGCDPMQITNNSKKKKKKKKKNKSKKNTGIGGELNGIPQGLAKKLEKYLFLEKDLVKSGELKQSEKSPNKLEANKPSSSKTSDTELTRSCAPGYDTTSKTVSSKLQSQAVTTQPEQAKPQEQSNLHENVINSSNKFKCKMSKKARKALKKLKNKNGNWASKPTGNIKRVFRNFEEELVDFIFNDMIYNQPVLSPMSDDVDIEKEEHVMSSPQSTKNSIPITPKSNVKSILPAVTPVPPCISPIRDVTPKTVKNRWKMNNFEIDGICSLDKVNDFTGKLSGLNEVIMQTASNGECASGNDSHVKRKLLPEKCSAIGDASVISVEQSETILRIASDDKLASDNNDSYVVNCKLLPEECSVKAKSNVPLVKQPVRSATENISKSTIIKRKRSKQENKLKLLASIFGETEVATPITYKNSKKQQKIVHACNNKVKDGVFFKTSTPSPPLLLDTRLCTLKEECSSFLTPPPSVGDDELSRVSFTPSVDDLISAHSPASVGEPHSDGSVSPRSISPNVGESEALTCVLSPEDDYINSPSPVLIHNSDEVVPNKEQGNNNVDSPRSPSPIHPDTCNVRQGGDFEDSPRSPSPIHPDTCNIRQGSDFEDSSRSPSPIHPDTCNIRQGSDFEDSPRSPSPIHPDACNIRQGSDFEDSSRSPSPIHPDTFNVTEAGECEDPPRSPSFVLIHHRNTFKISQGGDLEHSPRSPSITDNVEILPMPPGPTECTRSSVEEHTGCEGVPRSPDSIQVISDTPKSPSPLKLDPQNRSTIRIIPTSPISGESDNSEILSVPNTRSRRTVSLNVTSADFNQSLTSSLPSRRANKHQEMLNLKRTSVCTRLTRSAKLTKRSTTIVSDTTNQVPAILQSNPLALNIEKSRHTDLLKLLRNVDEEAAYQKTLIFNPDVAVLKPLQNDFNKLIGNNGLCLEDGIDKLYQTANDIGSIDPKKAVAECIIFYTITHHVQFININLTPPVLVNSIKQKRLLQFIIKLENSFKFSGIIKIILTLLHESLLLQEMPALFTKLLAACSVVWLMATLNNTAKIVNMVQFLMQALVVHNTKAVLWAYVALSADSDILGKNEKVPICSRDSCNGLPLDQQCFLQTVYNIDVPKDKIDVFKISKMKEFILTKYLDFDRQKNSFKLLDDLIINLKQGHHEGVEDSLLLLKKYSNHQQMWVNSYAHFLSMLIRPKKSSKNDHVTRVAVKLLGVITEDISSGGFECKEDGLNALKRIALAKGRSQLLQEVAMSSLFCLSKSSEELQTFIWETLSQWCPKEKLSKEFVLKFQDWMGKNV